jgi:hypothetical protein
VNLIYKETIMSELNPQPLPPSGRVRVYVSRDVAFDLGKMGRVTANVLNRLGCTGCHSGRVLEFVTMEDFVINSKTLEAQEVVAPAF